MAEFGDILEELRKDKGMTQKDLSEIIYVTTGTISNYESGQYMPDLQKLITLADYFGVTLDYLTGSSASNHCPQNDSWKLYRGFQKSLPRSAKGTFINHAGYENQQDAESIQ